MYYMLIIDKFKITNKNQKEKLLKSYHPEVTNGFIQVIPVLFCKQWSNKFSNSVY